MGTYPFILKFTGARKPPSVLQLVGRGMDYKDIEITVDTRGFPEEGKPRKGAIMSSNHESLFSPGSTVKLVRRMSDIEIYMD